MFFDESRDRKRRRSGDLLHHIVGPREDTFPVVLGNFDKVLHKEWWKLVQLLHLLLEHLDGSRRVLDLRPEHFAHSSGDFGMVHLDRTMEGVNFTFMACRLCKDVGDDPSLVVCADRRVTPIFAGKFDLLLGPDLLREMRTDEPFSKEGGTKMCRGHA